MASGNFRHVPILDPQGGLLGLVSQRDLLAAAGSSLFGEDREDSGEDYIALEAIMTEQVTTVDRSASLRGAALLLQQHKLGCLPVVEDGRLIGIVTDADFVGVAINLLEQLEEAEPEEL